MIPIAAVLLSILFCAAANAADRFITLSSTTSTQDSGLFEHILPIFKAATGIDVHVVAVGTGQALAIGVRGDADAPGYVAIRQTGHWLRAAAQFRIITDKFSAPNSSMIPRARVHAGARWNGSIVGLPNFSAYHRRGMRIEMRLEHTRLPRCPRSIVALV